MFYAENLYPLEGQIYRDKKSCNRFSTLQGIKRNISINICFTDLSLPKYLLL